MRTFLIGFLTAFFATFLMGFFTTFFAAIMSGGCATRAALTVLTGAEYSAAAFVAGGVTMKALTALPKHKHETTTNMVSELNGVCAVRHVGDAPDRSEEEDTAHIFYCDPATGIASGLSNEGAFRREMQRWAPAEDGNYSSRREKQKIER